MQQQTRYTLGKNERLKSRKVIEQLFKEGKSFYVFPFKIIWKFQPQQAFSLQAGFTVSTKYFKKAVDRNRIRRLMKEGYRLQKNALQKKLEINNKPVAVFIVYIGKQVPEYILVTKKIMAVLERLQNIIHENFSANN